ncbi:MAG: hypothetical protein J6I73_02590 [Treponema sp.]|nr:hypothetical protein [Treponema sp.]
MPQRQQAAATQNALALGAAPSSACRQTKAFGHEVDEWSTCKAPCGTADIATAARGLPSAAGTPEKLYEEKK